MSDAVDKMELFVKTLIFNIFFFLIKVTYSVEWRPEETTKAVRYVWHRRSVRYKKDSTQKQYFSTFPLPELNHIKNRWAYLKKIPRPLFPFKFHFQTYWIKMKCRFTKNNKWSGLETRYLLILKSEQIFWQQYLLAKKIILH